MALFVFAGCCAIWSTTYYAIRVCLRGYLPLTGAAIRFLLASLLLAGLIFAVRLLGKGRGALDRRERLAIALAALINAVSYGITYYAETRITGGAAAVLTSASPFFATLFARLAGLERFQPRKLVGIGVGLCGIAVLFYDGAKQGLGVAGDTGRLWAMAGMVVSSSLFWPAYNVILKRHAARVDTARANLRFLFWTGVWLVVGALVLELPRLPTYGTRPTLALIYLAVMGSVVAWSGYFWMLKRLDISTLSTMVFIQPTAALLVDVAMGDDRLTTRGYLGASLVLLGVLLTAVRFRRPAADAKGPQV